MTETDMQHDVIVIGAGIAGLVAANRAAQLGKRVVVANDFPRCRAEIRAGALGPNLMGWSLRISS